MRPTTTSNFKGHFVDNKEAHGFIFHPDDDRPANEVNWYDELKYKTPRDDKASHTLKMLKKAMKTYGVHKKSFRDLGDYILRMQLIDDHRYSEWKKEMSPQGYKLHFMVYELWKKHMRTYFRKLINDN